MWVRAAIFTKQDPSRTGVDPSMTEKEKEELKIRIPGLRFHLFQYQWLLIFWMHWQSLKIHPITALSAAK